MVFGLDGQALIGRIEGRAFGDGPRFQCPISFQPEVVVQAPRGMFLDHEKAARLRGFSPRGLRGAVEAPFAAVFFPRCPRINPPYTILARRPTSTRPSRSPRSR